MILSAGGFVERAGVGRPAAPAVGTGLPYSTTFATAENPLSEGSIWQLGSNDGLDWNNPLTTGGNCIAAVSMPANPPERFSDCIAHLKSATYPANANQYAQAVLYLSSGYSGDGGKHEVQLYLRASITANSATGYEVLYSVVDGGCVVVRWNGSRGSYTSLTNEAGTFIGTPADGAVVYAQISGTNVTVKFNGSTQLTCDVTNQGGTTYSTGQPGLGFWPADGADRTKAGWKSWDAGNL